MKKRWQKYTEELYKKDLHDPDNHNGVIIHLEPDILECEVKWTLGSITTNKASRGDGILAKLFQILKMMLLMSCTQYASKYGKVSMTTEVEKISFHFNPKERQCPRMFKLPHICTCLTSSTVMMFKILQARLQQSVN